MTAPGQIIPAQPGWWPKVDRVGINESEYGWEDYAEGYSTEVMLELDADIEAEALRQLVASGSLAVTASIVAAAVKPTFDIAGTVATGSATPVTTGFTAALNADVFVAVIAQYSGAEPALSATYDGNAMAKIGEVAVNNIPTYGKVGLFRKAGGGTGTSKTVSVATGGGFYTAIAPFSWRSVTSVSAAQTSYGNSASESQVVTPAATDTILHVFGNQGYGAMTDASGGTSRVYYNSGVGANGQGLSVRSYAAVETTFAASIAVVDNWGGIAVLLT